MGNIYPQAHMIYKNIAIISDITESARKIFDAIQQQYNFIDLTKSFLTSKNFDLIIVLGGDGFMLHCIHTYMHLNIPFYGINCGTVGFLLNPLSEENLLKKINSSVVTTTYPLEMIARWENGLEEKKLAINEVSLFRSSSQAARIKIIIDSSVRLEELVCDGVLLSTPAGSSAYNSSVNGPILPMGSNILALSPISPFKPKKWSGAILPSNAEVELIIMEYEKRKVRAVADFLEVDYVKSVKIRERKDLPIKLLFDNNHSLEERIIKEQFSY